MQSDKYYWLGLGLAAVSALFLVLAMGALGIVGDGGSPDRLYLVVLAVGAVGTIVARLRARGMARTLLAMAGTQALVTVIVLGAVLLGVEEFEGASIVDLVGINAMYVALFVCSAWLFLRSSRATVPAAAGTSPRR